MEKQQPERGGVVSRRGMIAGTSAVAFLASLGIDVAAAEPAFATTPPTTAAGVINLARSYLGQTLGQIEPTTDLPWSGYGIHDWCMWFVSWCLRGLGYGYHTYADELDFLPAHATPQVGDIAVFGSYHIGFVSTVNPVSILDGNRVSTGKPPTTTVVNEGPNFDSPVFRRPAYLTTNPTVTTDWEDSDMMIIYCGDGAGKYGPVNASYYALVTDSWRLPLTSYNLASQLLAQFGVKNTDGTPKNAAYSCSYAEWEAFLALPPLTAPTTLPPQTPTT